MDISAQYTNAEKTKVSVQFTNISKGDLPVEYGVTDMEFQNLDLNVPALIPQFVAAWIGAGGKPAEAAS